MYKYGQDDGDPSWKCVGLTRSSALCDIAETALTAYGLPLDGGTTSKTGQLASFANAFDNIFASKSGDLAALADIQDSLNACVLRHQSLSP